MQGTTSVKGEAETEAVPPAMQEEEERYVKVASRFFRVKQPRHDDGGSCSSDNNTPPRRLHYLESCFLCKKDIDCNRDVFMYKGDAAFCSDECRQDQMDMDEALHAVARLLSSHAQSADAPVMRRRPTIANLAARSPPVPAS